MPDQRKILWFLFAPTPRALLTMVHHHFSAPTISTKQTFLTFIFYYATLFRRRHAVHTASRIFAIDGRLQKSAPSSLTLLAMIYHHCSISTTSTKQKMLPSSSTVQHSFGPTAGVTSCSLCRHAQAHSGPGRGNPTSPNDQTTLPHSGCTVCFHVRLQTTVLPQRRPLQAIVMLDPLRPRYSSAAVTRIEMISSQIISH